MPKGEFLSPVSPTDADPQAGTPQEYEQETQEQETQQVDREDLPADLDLIPQMADITGPGLPEPGVFAGRADAECRQYDRQACAEARNRIKKQ